MTEQGVKMIVVAFCLAWVAIALIRYLGVFGLIAVIGGFVVIWPTIEKLLLQ